MLCLAHHSDAYILTAQILGATTFTFDAAGRSISGNNREQRTRAEREEARLSHFKKRSSLESVNTKQLEKNGIELDA